ncbi:septum formation initiator family protein [Saccharibacillus sp. CPCC 101409]|uniref:FtsB family cell division protein n=1 Tax=Saccharibacillus sp. CPCC 101409 TaxID=3058041 RepID=UPI002672D0E4|nr:septum formation initiator family protein [Saccharibacillus sp. CPCC 101409]MDO3412898.1 septum formation initiator family protein [Saccharibacillus sp. CPCC 101409]
MRATSTATRPNRQQQTERPQQAVRTQQVRKTSPNRQQGGKRRIRLWALLMIVLIGWAVYTLVSQSSVIADKSGQLQERQTAKSESSTQLQEVKDEIKRLQDPEYIAQIARKEYNMYKPEEIPIKVIGEGGGE